MAYEVQSQDAVRALVELADTGVAQQLFHPVPADVSVTAEDLPALTLSSGDGYRVLSTDVATETEKTDTGFIAHLEQSWEIYIETDEVTTIDAVHFAYWNPELAATEVASVPRQRVEPLPRDALALRDQMRGQVLAEHRAKRLALVALLSLPAAALIAFLALALWRALPTRADLRFWRAAGQAGAPLEFYASFLFWARQALGSRAAVGQDQVAALGARATAQVERLHGVIFGSRGGDLETRRIAATLIWGARRMTTARLVSAIIPSLSRFLFLR